MDDGLEPTLANIVGVLAFLILFVTALIEPVATIIAMICTTLVIAACLHNWSKKDTT